MEIVFMLLIAGGIYVFLKGRPRRSAEAVRAHMYLTAIADGVPAFEAHLISLYNVAQVTPADMGAARLRADKEYGGKSLKMIANAYHLGMPSLLSRLEQIIIGWAVDEPTTSNEQAAKTEDWIRPFTIFYASCEMMMGKMSDNLEFIATERTNLHVESSVNESVLSYFRFTKRENIHFDLGYVTENIHRFLKSEIRSLNNRDVVRLLVQRDYALAHGRSMPIKELDAEMSYMDEVFALSDEALWKWRDATLKSRLDELFESTHGRPFPEFLREMSAFQEASPHH